MVDGGAPLCGLACFPAVGLGVVSLDGGGGEAGPRFDGLLEH